MATNLKKKKTISPKTLSNITQGELYSVICFVFLFQPIFRIHVDPIINRFYVHNLIEMNKCRLHSLSQNVYDVDNNRREKSITRTHNKSDSTLIELRYKWNSMDKVLIYLHCIFLPLLSLSQYILYCNIFSQFVAICSGYCWLLLLVHSLVLFFIRFSFIFFFFCFSNFVLYLHYTVEWINNRNNKWKTEK